MSLSWPKPVEPSESHRLLFDNKNICVFRLNSTATGSLTWRKVQLVSEALHEKEVTKEVRSFLTRLPYLLESDVQVEGDWSSGTADRWDCVFHNLGSCAGDQLHCVGPWVVSDLYGAKVTNTVSAIYEVVHLSADSFHAVLLTAKSEVKVHCWTGWL